MKINFYIYIYIINAFNIYFITNRRKQDFWLDKVKLLIVIH